MANLSITNTHQSLENKSLGQKALYKALETMANTNELLTRNLTTCAHKIRILQDLLYTKAQSSKSPFSLKQLADTLTNHLTQPLKDTNAKLEVSYSPSKSECEIEIDLLKQVLFILLQNSMEHAF